MLGIELKDWGILGKHSTTEHIPSSPLFCLERWFCFLGLEHSSLLLLLLPRQVCGLQACAGTMASGGLLLGGFIEEHIESLWWEEETAWI